MTGAMSACGPKRDMAITAANVRFRGNSGRQDASALPP
jgi:hypothetical protein